MKKRKEQVFLLFLSLRQQTLFPKRIEERKGQVFIAILVLETTNTVFQRESKKR